MGETTTLTDKREHLWQLLAEVSAPGVLNAFTGEIGYIMPYMKVSIEEGNLYAVYTDSNLYPDITSDDLDKIIKMGVVDGIRSVAYDRAWSRLRALREQLLLNRARGAFKKEQEKELEILKLIVSMRRIKHAFKLILNT